MRGRRLQGLGHIFRQQPYEVAFALACLSALWALRAGSGSGAVARVLPHWGLVATDLVLAAGGALTLFGLVVAGSTLDDVRRVLGRRVEQGGQFLIAGVFAATAIVVYSLGSVGTVPGAVYTALAAASATRAAMIGHTFAQAGRDRTDLG